MPVFVSWYYTRRINCFSGRVNLGPTLHVGEMELMNCSFKGYAKCVVIDIRRLGGYLPGVFGIYVWQRGLWLKRFYILKPSGHYMYHQFNIQQFCVLPTQCIYVFCVDLRTNSDYFPIQHWLTGFYNRDGVCLMHGTDWVFKYNSGRFLSLNS